MRAPIVIIGIGELGSEFARGFMRCGYPIYPVTRQMDIEKEYLNVPSPELVLVTVQEKYLDNVLKQLPDTWRDKLCLVQNELLPTSWLKHQIFSPTVAVVWFEKKPGMVLHNILYTPVFGPQTQIVTDALTALAVPSKTLQNEQELLYELLRKTLYILTVNICGLVENISVGLLWQNHQPFASAVATEIVALLERITGEKLSPERLIAGMVEGIEDCPQRKCLGRSAVSRLHRTVEYARETGIACPNIDRIYRNCQ